MIDGPESADINTRKWALEFWANRVEGKPVNTTEMRLTAGGTSDTDRLQAAIDDLRERIASAEQPALPAGPEPLEAELVEDTFLPGQGDTE